MCHFGSVYCRFLFVGSPLFRRNVVIFPSCYLSFFDSCPWIDCGPLPGCPGAGRLPVCLCARDLAMCPCARVPGCLCARGLLVPVCPCARVPVCPCARVPVCPCARVPVPVDSSCARVPVDRPRARVSVCPQGREETYLESCVCERWWVTKWCVKDGVAKDGG